jgi:hypothetical protein
LLGSLPGLVVAVGEAEELVGEGEELEGEGVGVADLDGFGVGVGLGEDVPEAGSIWQLVSVLALELVEVPRLCAAAPCLRVPACAVPDSTLRVRKHPPTTLSAGTRMCARRMRIAVSPLLIRVTVCSSWVRRRLGDGWVSVLISVEALSYACLPHSRSRPGRFGGSTARPLDGTVPAPRSVPFTSEKFVLLAKRQKGPGLRRHTADHEDTRASSDARASRGAAASGGTALLYLVPTKPRASRPGAAAVGTVTGSAE